MLLALMVLHGGELNASGSPRAQEKERTLRTDVRSYETTGERIGIYDESSGMLGFVKSFAGGIAKAEVGTHRLGEEHIEKKHITSIVYEPITIEVGMDMTPDFYKWIGKAFQNMDSKKSGEAVFYDFDGFSMEVREFLDARITEVSFPEFARNSNEPVILMIRMEPGQILYKPGTGSHMKGIAKTSSGRAEWLCSNFHFTLGDLPCNRVLKIESFTWKLGVIRDEVGQFRLPTKHRIQIAQVPNIKLLISMADAKAWQDWHRSFIIEGNSSDADELHGSIELLSSDGSTAIARIGLINAGLFSLRKVSEDSSTRIEVELYVEQMTFDFHDPPQRME